MKLKQISFGGIPMVVIDYSLEFDDEVILMRIRETQRIANIGGIVHEPGNPIMSDIPVDEEFSMLCSERLI